MDFKTRKFLKIIQIVLCVICFSIAGCGDSKKSCDDGQFKLKPVGDCDNPGVCFDKPEICPDLWAPVCGCDGNTYGNECDAAAAGVSIQAEGVCPVSCNSNTDIIDPDSYCKKTEGDCDGTGTAEVKPYACYEIYAPVCGCDGNTYGNDCEAAAAGVNVAAVGECSIVCSSNSDVTDSEKYCKKPAGDCSAVGRPETKPDACPDVWDPVCGCDGNTYSNECYAAAAGVNVNSDGSCP